MEPGAAHMSSTRWCGCSSSSSRGWDGVGWGGGAGGCADGGRRKGCTCRGMPPFTFSSAVLDEHLSSALHCHRPPPPPLRLQPPMLEPSDPSGPACPPAHPPTCTSRKSGGTIDTASCRVMPPTSFSSLMNSWSSPSTATLRSCRVQRAGCWCGGECGVTRVCRKPAGFNCCNSNSTALYCNALHCTMPISLELLHVSWGSVAESHTHLIAREVHLPGQLARVPGQRVWRLHRLAINLRQRQQQQRVRGIGDECACGRRRGGEGAS